MPPFKDFSGYQCVPTFVFAILYTLPELVIG
jgi:hypothetical protein